MERLSNQPRRPSLATIVGSGLAVVAAGSLLAFSSLAEQAGLQGLSTNGVRPASPVRSGGAAHAITVPAPVTAPSRDPREAVTELVRRVVERDERPVTPAAPAVVFVPRGRGPKSKPEPKPEPRTFVAAAAPEVEEWGGPPYGHAYGYHKKRGERPEPARRHKKDRREKDHEAPVYARTTGNGKAKGPKPPKLKKVPKAASGNTKGEGKAHGHDKHKHGKGKAKGHSKHGR